MKYESNYLPQCLLPEKLEIYKIPIKNCSRHVYMAMPEYYGDTHSAVLVISEKFLAIWHDSPKFDDGQFKAGVPYAEVPHLWHLGRKLNECLAEKGFTYGFDNPVPFAVVSSIINKKLYLTNGITRTLWLLVNNTKSFPIACPHEFVDDLVSLAGI